MQDDVLTALEKNLSLFFSGDDYLNHLLDSLNQAKKFVIVEAYIFAYDGFGENFVEVLNGLANRGVSVWILVDGVGSYFYISRLTEKFQNPLIAFRIYNPVGIGRRPWTWIDVPQWMTLTRTINKRDHRKLIIIDGEKSYLGSANLTAVHFQKYFKEHAWRDTCLCLDGQDPRDLIRSFLKIWDKSYPSTREKSSLHSLYDRGKLNNKGTFRFNFSLRQRVRNSNELHRRIRRAKKRVLITTPYFLPRFRLVRHLRQASLRGVEVILLLPEMNDVPLVKWASRCFYGPLLQRGVRIFEFQPRVLHAKSLVVDNWVKLGSSNLNQRSLLHDLELELAADLPSVAQKLADQFIIDLKSSREFTKQDWKNMGIFEKLRNRLALLVKYWM